MNFIDDNNIGHVVGVIKSNANTDVKIVNILATLKDKHGKTLDIPHGPPIATKLRPGESTTFEIELLQTVFRVADIESIVFHVDATG